MEIRIYLQENVQERQREQLETLGEHRRGIAQVMAADEAVDAFHRVIRHQEQLDGFTQRHAAVGGQRSSN